MPVSDDDLAIALNKLRSSLSNVNISLTSRIDRESVASWLSHQTNENGKPIRVTEWLIDLIYTIANVRLHRAYVSGAAQVAKTLVSVLSTKAVVDHYHGLRIGWVYATRTQSETYPTIQINPIMKGELTAKRIKVGRDSVIYIRHANTSRETAMTVGMSVAKTGLSSVTLDWLNCDESSQWVSPVDPQDRVKQSVFVDQPMRFFGTPGSGRGIEKLITAFDSTKIPCTATCGSCNKQVPADLYDIVKHDVDKVGRPYNYSFVDCPHCGSPASHYHSWRFIEPDRLPLAIDLWLHPFLHSNTPDEMEATLKLISRRSLTDGSVSNIYQQVLGVVNKHSDNCVLMSDIKRVRNPYPDETPKMVVYGIDGGRKHLYISCVECYSGDRHHVSTLTATNITNAIDYLNHETIKWKEKNVPIAAAFDFYPDCSEMAHLRDNVKLPCLLGVQVNSPSSGYDYKTDFAFSNGIQYSVIKYQYVKWVRTLIETIRGGNLTFAIDVSELMERHITAVRIDEHKVFRPADKSDDLFFSLVFAFLAKTILAYERSV